MPQRLNVLQKDMGIINALFGTASQVDANQVTQQLSPVLIDGENVAVAFKVVRDLFVFTEHRLILVDKQGITGKKVEYHSIPYKSIVQFSVETAGRFDMDAELKIWVSGLSVPVQKEFKKGTDIVALQKALATFILSPNKIQISQPAPPAPPALPNMK